MQLAAPAPSTPLSPAHLPATPGPGGGFTAPPETDPSHAVYEKYFRAFARVPGVEFFGWNSAEPGVIHLVMQDADTARFAENLLQPTVEGAKLAIRLVGNHTFKHADGTSGKWYDSGSSLLTGLAAMPGVEDLIVDSGTAAALTTTEQQATDLAKLIKPNLAGYYVGFIKSPYHSAAPAPAPTA